MSVAQHEALLAASEQTFRASFFMALEEKETVWEAFVSALAMEMSTPGIETVNHRWADPVPDMTKFNEDRRIGKLGVKGLSVSNEDYANGVEIAWPDLRRDRLNLYMPRIRQLARKAKLLKMKNLLVLLNGGFTATGYDEVTFFNNTHPLEGSAATWDNYSDDVLDQAAYKTALTRLKETKDDNGEYMDLVPTHLIVGTGLEWTAKEILEQATLSNGSTNITRGTTQLIVSPRITDKYWFVADLSQPEKPFIVQEEEPVSATFLDKPDSPDKFHRNKLIFGAQGAWGFGYGLPHLIQGSDGSGS